MTVSPGFLEGCCPGGWALASQLSGDPSPPLGTWLPSGASGDRWGVDLHSGDSGTLSQAGDFGGCWGWGLCGCSLGLVAGWGGGRPQAQGRN